MGVEVSMGAPTDDGERDRLLARVREVYGDDELHTDHVGLQRAPGLDRWRVVSGRRGVVAVAQTEIEALRSALMERMSPSSLGRGAPPTAAARDLTHERPPGPSEGALLVAR
jgi:hypothetical protein